MTWMGAAVFLLVVVLLILGLRRRPPDDADPIAGRPEEGRRWLLGGGIILPAAGISVVFGLTLSAMTPTFPDTGGEVTVEVVGYQWWWQIRYPDSGVLTANEIHIPAGVPIDLRLVSEDVIHSFWAPDLGGKIDLLPDRPNSYMIQADSPGEYRGVCAEFCGLQHARMRFLVVATDGASFQTWLEEQAGEAVAPDDMTERRGLEVFEAAGCGDCHTIRGTPHSGDVGPDLTHLAGRQTLAAATLDNTPANLAAWITDPHQFKEGVGMPASELTQDDLGALVAYLESLE